MRGKEFLRKVQFYLLLTLGTYPVCACIIIYIRPELLSYMWLLSAAFGLLGCLSLALSRKPRLALGILGTVVFLVPAALLLQGDARNILLLFGAGYSALLLWSLQIAGWESEREIEPGILGGCLTVLLAGCLLSHYEPRLTSVSLGIRISFFVFIYFAMRSLNRGSLQLASGGKGTISTLMRRKNLLLIMGMFGVAALIALLPSLFRLVKALIGWIGGLIKGFAAMLPEPTQPETTISTTAEEVVTGEGLDVLTEGLQTHRTSQATFVMMAVISLGIMVPVAAFALYKLGKALWKAIHNAVQQVLDGANTVAEDFEDEITDTREEEAELFYKTPEMQKRPALEKLTPAQRIRRRYKRLQSKNPTWQHSSTARENLSEAAASLYEKARYSNHPITEQDAEDFKNKTK